MTSDETRAKLLDTFYGESRAAFDAALTAHEQALTGWQTIDLAPKQHDGLLLSDGLRVSYGGWLSDEAQGAEYEGQWGCAGWWSVDGIENPTHFMLLKPPPVVTPS